MNKHQELIDMLGESNVLTDIHATEPYDSSWRARFSGRSLAVLRPDSAQQVAQIVRWCSERRIPIVPQGGNTSLCGGATPDDSGESVVLSLARLNKIRNIDLYNDTIEVEAGCVLQTIQQAADDADRLFPLSLAAEGTCTIGGNLATNAGGTQVLRYGNSRNLVLGIEVVTAEGEIWNGLRGLRKDNTGYALRDLYVGSEGTLGIITAAVMSLQPRPKAERTAFISLASIENALLLLNAARKGFGMMLTSFEIISLNCLEAVTACYPEQRMPFEGASATQPWYVLIELSDSENVEHLRGIFEAVIGDLLEKNIVQDAIIAETGQQSEALWHLRESIPLSDRAFGPCAKFDISLPISKIGTFIADSRAALGKRFPGLKTSVFGHLGDGNLHCNVLNNNVYSPEDFQSKQAEIYELIYDEIHKNRGSISAEHGVGQLKVDALTHYKSPTELALMQRIKAALDPLGILNPGKVVRV